MFHGRGYPTVMPTHGAAPHVSICRAVHVSYPRRDSVRMPSGAKQAKSLPLLEMRLGSAERSFYVIERIAAGEASGSGVCRRLMALNV
jgi:hypothetical protein